MLNSQKCTCKNSGHLKFRGKNEQWNEVHLLTGKPFCRYSRYTQAALLHYYKSIHIAPHKGLSTSQKIKTKEGKNREQKLWKQVSFQLPLEHKQGLRFTKRYREFIPKLSCSKAYASGSVSFLVYSQDEHHDCWQPLFMWCGVQMKVSLLQLF